MGSNGQEVARVLLCGGIAGVVTWASVFPLDVIKTRVQTQALRHGSEGALLLGTGSASDGFIQQRRLGAIEVARNAYRGEVREFSLEA